MTNRVNKRFWIQALSVLLVLLGMIGWLVYAETKPFDRNQLKIEVAKLRSHAAEGRLLAEEASLNSVPQTFFQTQTYLLIDKTETAKTSLDQANVDHGLEVSHWQSRRLAAQLQHTLEELNSTFGNPSANSSMKGTLAELFKQLKELENGLSQ